MKIKPDYPSINILGLKVNSVNMAETLSFVSKTVKNDEFSQILTLNAEIAYLSFNDKERRKLVNNCDLVTPDGSGIMWAAEQYGSPVSERVAGIDLLQNLLGVGAKEQYRFYFLGAKEDIVAEAAKKVKTQYNCNVVGFHNGFFSDDESLQIVDDIKNSGANILFVAMGYPRQDMWIAKYAKSAGVNVGVGVGGSFDVLAGKVKRAPAFWQNIQMEWFYRLLKDPRRLKRTMNLPKFMSAVKKDINKKEK
ncbi:MAG: WecB/TagA/CpsF family glycosyltransferase [Clostridiales bacterium]